MKRVHAYGGDFSVMSNAIFDDTRVSDKAVGLFCRLWRKPDDWEFHVRSLTGDVCTSSVNVVYRLLSELEGLGYVRRRVRRQRGRGNLVGAVEYVLDDCPSGSVAAPAEGRAEAREEVSRSAGAESVDGPSEGASAAVPGVARCREFVMRYAKAHAVCEEAVDTCMSRVESAIRNGGVDSRGRTIRDWKRYIETTLDKANAREMRYLAGV